MHYKNGRPAKDGDRIINLPSGDGGILYNATAGSDTCNGRISRTSPNDSYITIKECLHIEDVKAATIPSLIPGLGLIALLALIPLLLLAPTTRAADTNLPPVPTSTSSFFETASAYFTAFNTNADMAWTQRGEAAAGIASIQGPINLANDLRLSYEVYNSAFLDSATRSTGIAGTWLSQQLGIGYAFKVHDAKLSLFADAGYNFAEPGHRYFGEIGARVAKKMTRYTFAGVGFAAQVPTGRQVFTAFAGFNF